MAKPYRHSCCKDVASYCTICLYDGRPATLHLERVARAARRFAQCTARARHSVGVGARGGDVGHHSARAVAALPAGIGVVAAWILNGVENAVLRKGLPQHFWWVVGGEVVLNVVVGLLTPRHRLLRQPAGRSLHALRQRAGDAAGGAAGPDYLRRSRLLRPAGAGARPGHRPAGDDPADGAAAAADAHHADLDQYSAVVFALAGAAAGARRAADLPG